MDQKAPMLVCGVKKGAESADKRWLGWFLSLNCAEGELNG
jgi:hypothetical protein